MAVGIGGFHAADGFEPTVTESYTYSSGLNKMLLVVTTALTSGVTYDGTALTDLGIVSEQSKDLRLWVLLDADFPATPGAYDVVVTADGQAPSLLEMVGVEVHGAQQDTNIQSIESGIDGQSLYTQTMSYNDSCYLLDFAFSAENTVLTEASSQTVFVASVSVLNETWMVGGLAVSSQGLVSSNWTSTLDEWTFSLRFMIRDVAETEFEPTHDIVQTGPTVDSSLTATTTITATLDSPATSGNLVVARVAVDKDSGAFNTPTGWNLATSFNAANSCSHAIFWRQADGTAADNSVDITWTTAEQALAQLVEVDGFSGTISLSGSSSAGSTAVVSTLSTGATASLTQPAFAISTLATDGNPQWDSFPNMTNNFVNEMYHHPDSATVGIRNTYSHIRADGTVETTYTNNVETGEQCSAGVAVFESEGEAPTTGEGDTVVGLSATSDGTATAVITPEDGEGASAVSLSVASDGTAVEVGEVSNVIDHTCVNPADNEIPQEWLDAGAAQKILFNHQSVGNDILRGMADLNALATVYDMTLHSGDDWPEPTIAWYTANDGIGDFRRGDNFFPDLKIGFLDSIMRGNDGFDEFGSVVEIAFQKYCFVDIDVGDDYTAIWNTYITTIEALRASYPNIAFPIFTAPLNSTGKMEKDAFNDLARAYAATHPSVLLFDIADIEAHEPDGTPVINNGYQALYSGYTSDGGHLDDAGNVGRQRVARAMHWMFARLAGWDALPEVVETGEGASSASISATSDGVAVQHGVSDGASLVSLSVASDGTAIATGASEGASTASISATSDGTAIATTPEPPEGTPELNAIFFGMSF